ncbi:MAG: 3-phosphoglycerate dehydrogenase family protein [Oscillospiraceae bacterium]
MFKILTLNKISSAGLDNFDTKKYTYGLETENPDAIMVRSASMHEMDFQSDLKAIARAGAGVNNIPIDKCTEKGIVVFNTPGANANAVKEMVICAMLLCSRKIIQANKWAETLIENEDSLKAAEKGKSNFAGPEIKGKKLGVIGLGAIGGMVANAAIDLGMEVYGCDPFISVDGAWGLSSQVNHINTYSELYSICDYITIHAPFNSETKDMINSQTISQMKKGVRILNFARGELVNNTDILKAVEDGDVSCYITDFAAKELLCKENILVFPHLAASTPESEENCADMAATQLIDFLENGNIKNSVNLPNVSSPRVTKFRIGVIHKNIPNMLSAVTTALSENDINIEEVTSKAKKDNAYTMLDISNDCEDAVLKKLEQINGIYKALKF